MQTLLEKAFAQVHFSPGHAVQFDIEYCPRVIVKIGDQSFFYSGRTAISKSDGDITPDEIRAVRAYIKANAGAISYAILIAAKRAGLDSTKVFYRFVTTVLDVLTE